MPQMFFNEKLTLRKDVEEQVYMGFTTIASEADIKKCRLDWKDA